MLPGKAYRPEDYLRIIWSRKWLLVVPAIVVSTATYFWADSLPNRYSSSTTIAVVPQKVPTAFVRSTINSNLAQRLQSIQQQILSRARLERLIEEFNLYEQERKTMIMEDLIETMRRRDIRIRMARSRRSDSPSSFTVGFEYTQPRVAMQVTERLGSMFVQENLQEREVLADSTSQFLEAQLEDARRRLAEHEQKLAEFRKKHFGALPGQTQSNLQMLQMTQNQIQSNSDAAARDRDRLASIEKELGATPIAPDSDDDPEASNDDVDAAATPATPGVTIAKPEGNSGRRRTATQQLAAAKAELKAMELRLKPTHPDVVRLKRTITELEPRAAEEAANADSSPARMSPARFANLKKEAEQLRRSLERRKVDDERLVSQLAIYKQRVEIAPQLDTELTELTRGWDAVRQQFDQLNRKSEDAKLAASLERRQIGEQFRVVESARLPERPVSPDRTRLNLMGLGGGVAFGLLLIGLLEYRDTTLKSDDDIVVSLALPVLAVIPMMVTSAARRRQKRRRVAVAVAASLVVMLAVTAVAWRMQLLQPWVR